jgi:hypothetical protein
LDGNIHDPWPMFDAAWIDRVRSVLPASFAWGDFERAANHTQSGIYVMRYLTPWNVNCRSQKLAFILCLTLYLSFEDSAAAQSTGSTLVRVEEDWVALIGEPDPETSSPQIMNFISPIQSTEGIFGLVQVNHRGAPEFQDGGLQVQGWVGSWLSGSFNAGRYSKLDRSTDNLRYTVAMEKVSNGIKFQLLNGRSRTWGRFATTPVSVVVTVDEPSLEAYSPEFSVANTNVNLGAHRVELLYLTATRFRYSDDVTITDNTDRVIHRYQLNVEDISVTAYEANPDEYNVEITE